MKTPKVLEYRRYLHSDELIRHADHIMQGGELLETIAEDGVEFQYMIRFNPETEETKAIFDPEWNRTFDLIEDSELFWDYDHHFIYQKVGDRVVDAVTGNWEGGWYDNAVTGGPATITELEANRAKVRPEPKWWNDTVSDKQLEKIASLGGDITGIFSKKQASDLIERLLGEGKV